jgi:hypothetical protein
MNVIQLEGKRLAGSEPDQLLPGNSVEVSQAIINSRQGMIVQAGADGETATSDYESQEKIEQLRKAIAQASFYDDQLHDPLHGLDGIPSQQREASQAQFDTFNAKMLRLLSEVVPITPAEVPEQQQVQIAA